MSNRIITSLHKHCRHFTNHETRVPGPQKFRPPKTNSEDPLELFLKWHSQWHMYPPLYVWTINKSHLPRKKQLRSSIESSTAQDMLWPILGLISRGDCYLMQKTQSDGWPCPYMAAMKIWTTMLRHSVFVSEMLLQRHTQLRAPKKPFPTTYPHPSWNAAEVSYFMGCTH